ncbi:MAG TPA: dehydrogenase, partial [Chitinophagaceae bacterium]|nr:dehydrogenase [Chitinophagaceae bacterium]
GRIFRITPEDAKPAEWTKGLKLGDATIGELIKNLSNLNSWWRMNAQRLLIDRADKNAVPALLEMTTNASAMGRLHALWTLEGLGELKQEQIEHSLKDSVAGIRENAVQLAELHLKQSPGLAKALLNLRNDPDAKVRFQLLLTLGFLDSPESAEVRNQILFSDINDPWVQIAALSASSSQTASLLKVVLDRYDANVPAYTSLVKRLTTMVGVAGKPEDIHQLIEKAASTKHASILQGLAEGLKSRKSPLPVPVKDQELLVNNFFDNPSDEMRKASLQFLQVINISDSTLKKNCIQKAARIMQDANQPTSKRAEAIEFIAIGDPQPYAEDLKQLVVPKEEFPVQLAALNTLSNIKGTAVSEY